MSIGAFMRSLFNPTPDLKTPYVAREFLPAALEVVETPASPTGRLLGLAIVLILLLALVWAFFGRVDIMATAPGRLTPVGDTKVIQPLETGMVRAIAVQNGQRVKAGDVLVQLDPTQTGADVSRMSDDLLRAELDVQRLEALKTAIATGRGPQIKPTAEASLALNRDAQAAAAAQWNEQVSKTAGLDQQIKKSEAESAETEAQIAKVETTVPILAEKERIHQDLTAQGYGTTLSLLDARQQASEARHEVSVLRARLREVGSARDTLARQRAQVRAEFAADTYADLRKAQERQGELAQETVKARSRSAATELRSPIDGVVDQLSVHTLGGVVTPAQPLMIVVPDRQGLVIQAELSDRDAGFVHAGQAAKVKIETFNFTRYGVLDGRVANVSRDVIIPATSSPDVPGSGEQRNAAKGPRPSYVARIQLKTDRMRVDGRDMTLQPGMTVIVDIRTGSRTILDFLLSPISRRMHDSLHER